MKRFLTTITICFFAVTLNAQVKPAGKKVPAHQKKTVVPVTTVISDTALIEKVTSPADTAKVPRKNIDPSLNPSPKTFNPTNSKLSNAKIKTPVYDPNMTGTGMPGDSRTGVNARANANLTGSTAAPDSIKIKESRNSVLPN